MMLLSRASLRARCQLPAFPRTSTRGLGCCCSVPRTSSSSSARPGAVRAAPADQGAPTTQQPQSAPGQEDELPVWVRREKERELQAAGKKGLPWPLYLVLSVLVAIAAVGSVFEYVDRNPVFGVIPPDSPLWAPILGLFAFTGLPTAGFLFFKGVNAANEAAEQQDRMDGYIK